MTKQAAYTVVTYGISAVWLINGLFCKILHLVPRHRLIVAEILGHLNASCFTVLIGIAEVLMFIWIISGIRSRLNAIVQVIVILAMNILELILAPGMLMWGPMNSVFALLFCALVLYNEYSIQPNQSQPGRYA
jgi:hypothetical protein